MGRARYSFVDADGQLHGMLTAEELSLLAEQGKVKPETVINDIPQVIPRRADTIPGVFGGRFVADPAPEAVEGGSLAGNDRLMANVIRITCAGYLGYFSTSVLMLTRQRDPLSDLYSPTQNWIGLGWIALEIAFLAYGASLVSRSSRVGLAIVAIVSLLMQRSTLYPSQVETWMYLLGTACTFGLFISCVYCTVRLVTQKPTD